MTIRIATDKDLPFLSRWDHHVSPQELARIVDLGRIYTLEAEGQTAGWLRWGLFWDNTPFMNMLYLLEPFRRRGMGTELVRTWERDMAAAGYPLVMTSTLANEQAQHFYRRLGYRDAGGLLLPGEALEILLIKEPAAS